MDSGLAGKPAPRNDDIPAFFRTLLDEILHAVSATAELLGKPYLLPKYDDPEFAVRGIRHLYAGWFDGNPAYLKPAPAAELAAKLASPAGGEDKLAERAKALANAGKLGWQHI